MGNIRKIIFLAVIMANLLIGCGIDSSSMVLTKTRPVNIVQTSLPSQIPAYRPTSTKMPGSTQLSITSTPIPMQAMVVPTSAPTLTEDERETYIIELLKTNAGCDLPCWWGIVPGKTSWEDVLQFILSIGARSQSSIQTDELIVHGTGGFDLVEPKILNRLSFYENLGIVEVISVHADGIYNPVDFQQAWSSYAPDQIMRKYGEPSRVWIKSSYSYGGSDKRGYDLWLFYDELGFLFIYSGLVKFDPIYHLCPQFDNGEGIESLDLIVQSQDNPQPLEQFTYYSDNQEYIKTIEETGLTVEELYSKYILEDEPCFDIPGTIFP